MKATTRRTKLSYIVSIPHISDDASLCVAEGERHIPFEIKRIYYILNTASGKERGKHVHKQTQQILFCLKGTIRVHLDNGFEKEVVRLDKPNEGIFLDAHMWHSMSGFTKNTVLLVLSSDYYDESDYIRNYDDFIEFIHKNGLNERL